MKIYENEVTIRACEKKWAVCDVNREPFHKCGTFAFWILLLNTLHLNMKIWKNMKSNYMQIKINQFNFCEIHFHETYFNCF